MVLPLFAGHATADEFLGNVEGWNVQTWVGEGGTVEGCSAEAVQPNDVVLTYYYSPVFGHEISFLSADWGLHTGQTYPVQIVIDQFEGWSADLIAISETSVYVQLTDMFVDEFHRGRTMRVIARNETLEFSLSGSARAIESAIDCARTRVGQRANPTSNEPDTHHGTENPFGGTDAPATTGKGTFSAGDGSEKSIGASQQAALIDRMFNIEAEEALNVMVEVVLDHRDFVGVDLVEAQDRPVILNPEYDHLWTDGDGVFGWAVVTAGDAEAQIQRLIQIADDACADGGISITRDAVELSPLGVTLYELALICQESGRAWNAIYSILPFRDRTMTFAHASRDLQRSEAYNNGVVDALVTWVFDMPE